MRYLISILIVLGTAACSSGSGGLNAPLIGKAGLTVGPPDRMAIDAANNGYCGDVVPILRCYAYQGRGNELSQATLGSCLVQSASNGDATWREGLTWLRRAAFTGLPEAQNRLIHALSQSHDDNDIVEAQMWRIVYERGKATPYPPAPLRSEVAATLDSRLTPALRSEAETRANGWSYRFWVLEANDVANAKAALAQCPRPRLMRAPRRSLRSSHG